jgi:hypothetical protein
MNSKRHYGIIFFIVIPVAILVLIRSASTTHFKHNARQLAAASFTNSNTVRWDQLGVLGTKSLIIDLSDQDYLRKTHPEGTVNIPFRSLLDKDSQMMLQDHNGPLLLYSIEPATAAKAWIILSEMGYHNLFILQDGADDEMMKFEFQPDTALSENPF